MSNTEKKITKAQKYDMLLAIAEVKENEMLVDFINAEKELLAKRNSYKSKKKSSDTNYAELFKEHLQADVLYTVSDVIKTVPALNGLTTQKVSPICNTLAIDGVLYKQIIKGRPYYSLTAKEN